MKNPYNLEELNPIEYVAKGLQLIKDNEEEGKKYLLTAAENNYIKAYHALGMYYAYKKSYQDALNYIFKAYENGFYNLKELLFVYVYAYAAGFKPYKRQMQELLQRIPNHTTLKDYQFLAHIGIALYIFDRKEEASLYLKKAIRKEEGIDAYYHLGLCYREGHGVDKDIEYSYTCFMLAEDYPSKEAIEKQLIKYKRKGFIKKKWKYKEKYALKHMKKIEKEK